MSNEKTPELRLGALEAGGTKMVLAVAHPDGTVLETASMPTTAPDDVVPRMAAWFAERDICALGVGTFGPAGVTPGVEGYGHILKTPKPGWSGYDLLGTLRRGVDVPMGFDTDVNAACLGEAVFGCAQGLDSVLYLTVGTGIGAGVMLGGQLLHGMLHPEAGHVLVEKRADDPGTCVCPFHDSCLEGLAAGPSIEARWGTPGKNLTGRPEVWEIEGDYLAQAVADMVLCYSPRKVILGGGVMKQQALFPIVREKVAHYLNGYLDTPELSDMDSYIVPNSLNDLQGILGCVELARRALA